MAVKTFAAAVARAARDGDAEAEASARQELATAKIEEYVHRVLAAAPPLTDEQMTRLVELLRPGRRPPPPPPSSKRRGGGALA